MRPITLLSTLITALALSACDSAERVDELDERLDRAVTDLVPADGDAVPAVPTADRLVVGPPADARYEAELTAAMLEWTDAFGAGEAIEMDMAGRWQSSSVDAYLFTTDRGLDEVHHELVQRLRAHGLLDAAHGEIETEPLLMGDPDQLEQAAAYGMVFPEGFLDRYREAYPRLREVTGRSAEFSFTDPAQQPGAARPDRYRKITIQLARPFLDPVGMTVHDRTGISYTVAEMERVN